MIKLSNKSKFKKQKLCCFCKEIKLISEFCKNKNTSDGLNYRCKECIKKTAKPRPEYQKKYREDNRDKKNKKQNIQYHENKEKINAKRRERYKNDKSIIDMCRKSARSYYLNNKEKIKNKVKHYNETVYKKQKILNVKKRKAIKQNLTVEHFKYEDIINKYGDKCIYCGGSFEHVDHYIPLCKKGSHSLENVRPSCSSCNLRKQSRYPEEFIAILKEEAGK